MENEDFKRGYVEGRKREALITLDNLYVIRSQITGITNESDMINVCIRDIERDFGIKKRRKRR